MHKILATILIIIVNVNIYTTSMPNQEAEEVTLYSMSGDTKVTVFVPTDKNPTLRNCILKYLVGKEIGLDILNMKVDVVGSNYVITSSPEPFFGIRFRGFAYKDWHIMRLKQGFLNFDITMKRPGRKSKIQRERFDLKTILKGEYEYIKLGSIEPGSYTDIKWHGVTKSLTDCKALYNFASGIELEDNSTAFQTTHEFMRLTRIVLDEVPEDDMTYTQLLSMYAKNRREICKC